MDKIKEAQQLAEKLLDEACICQVGDDKGALKDEPESIKKSEEDTKKAVKMEEKAKLSAMVDKINNYLGEDKEVKISDVPKDKQKIFKINRGKARIKGGSLTKAEKGGKPITPAKESKIFDMLDKINTYLGESKEIKISDVPKDKQKIFKINRGKARIKGGPLTKAEKGGKPVKEADQIKIAQQKDTLLDNNDRIVKDKVDKEASLDPVPTVESDKMIEGKIKDVFKTLKSLNYGKLKHGKVIYKDNKKMVFSGKKKSKTIKNKLKTAMKEQEETQLEGWFKDTVNFTKDAVSSARKGTTPKWIKKRRSGSDKPKDNNLMKALARRKKQMKDLKD